MEKIRWKKVFGLAIPLSIISIAILIFIINAGRVSKLIDGDFIGKKKTDFMKNEEVLLDKIVNIEIDNKNFDTFFFTDTNVCIGHFQTAEKRYFKDIYEKLIKRKGKPIGIQKVEGNRKDIITWTDRTELIYDKDSGVHVKEYGKGFEEYLKGL